MQLYGLGEGIIKNKHDLIIDICPFVCNCYNYLLEFMWFSSP